MRKWKLISLILLLTLTIASYHVMYQEKTGEKLPQAYLCYSEGEYWEALAKERDWTSEFLNGYLGGNWVGSLIPGSVSLFEMLEGEHGSSTDVYHFEEIKLKKNGIEILYPHFAGGASEEAMKTWNKIIDTDIEKLLDYYSFNPYPSPAGRSSPKQGMDTILLRITYDIKFVDHSYFSVLYKAAYNSQYVAHPTELVYTTNISLTDSKRLSLQDIIDINKPFVKYFRKEFKPADKGNEELNKAVADYLGSFSDKELLFGLQTSDIIGSGNYLGIFFYMVPGRLGISISAPNYLGDHLELEQDCSKLDRFLKK